jgi:hypothetical protein
MIPEEDSQVHVEVGRYEGRIEYRIIFSQENMDFAKAGCPGIGRLIGLTEEKIRDMLDMGKIFELYIDGNKDISNELGVASEHNVHTIYLGNKENLEATIDKFKHVPITLRTNSNKKLTIGYVTLERK